MTAGDDSDSCPGIDDRGDDDDGNDADVEGSADVDSVKDTAHTGFAEEEGAGREWFGEPRQVKRSKSIRVWDRRKMFSLAIGDGRNESDIVC